MSQLCGIDPAIKHRQDEEKAAKAMRAESLRMQTEQLAARNAAARQQRRSEALQLIADGVLPTDAATQLTVK